MRKNFTQLILLSVCLLASLAVYAQPKHALSLRYNALNYDSPRQNNADREFSDPWSEAKDWGIEAAYSYNVSDRTSITFPLKMGKAQVRRTSSDAGSEKLIGNLDCTVEHRFLKWGSIVNPSFHFGLGTGWFVEDDKIDMNIPMGLGLDIRLTKNLFITARTQYRPSSRSHDSWHHGLGLTQYLSDKPADRDGDGTPDISDKCIDIPGLPSLMGCPDQDGDGIADGDDKCPTVAGVAALMGCPDKDGDGITDSDDACPDVKGLAAFKGCPDTDNDGITDANDKCPKEAGPATNNGCPILDKDGDGVLDKDDACPNDKGTAATKGCPDRDKDGIADRDDACPDKPGVAAGKGCPDTDGDGIYDNEDRCPDKAGVARLRGCPEIKKEDKAKLERAIKLVQFESGKATLLQKSYAVLDEVVSVMNQYSEYSLNIQGHTDSQGDDAANLALSKNRAKTCYDYLVSKGIKAERMAHDGFGETKPVADNKTADGRAQNRRVEFELYVK
ncbi:MAG: OmpA family protein [Saprospiraceae bacterium]|nr:OmpA family protein [Saprospiraceae bacterium]